MPKSNPGLPFGRGSGAVTIIEQPVMRSYIRKAKIVFFIIWAAVALLAATVLVSKWEPKFGATGAGILALITGGLIGLVPARSSPPWWRPGRCCGPSGGGCPNWP